MYTLLINEDNTLTCSIKERIVQRSKLVDTLHFLADQTYKGENMSDYTVLLEYLLPVSKSYQTEFLQKADELYKNKLEYTLPFDTNLTSEAGDIEMHLTFYKVEMQPDGTTLQHVRKVGPGVVHIVSLSDWSAIIPDKALTPLDQRIIALEALNQAMIDRLNASLDNKADNLRYEDDKLQLTSGGKPIGNVVEITKGTSSEVGNLRVVEF